MEKFLVFFSTKLGLLQSPPEILSSRHDCRSIILVRYHKIKMLRPFPIKSAFQLYGKLQAGTLCHSIQSIAKKHYRIMPCIGKNTYCKKYGTYPDALSTRSVTLVVLKSTNCIVQFLMIWDPGITECFMGVPYYPGNNIEVCPSACRGFVVQHS